MTCRILALLLLAASPCLAASSRCLPAARLEGPPAAVEAIAGILRERGVEIASSDAEGGGCGLVEATILSSGDSMRLEITDAAGRTSRRDASSPEGAATLVESWVRGDLASSLFAAPPATEPAPLAVSTTSRSRPALLPIAGSILGGPGVASDRSIWGHTEIAAHTSIDRYELGARIAGDLDTRLAGHSRSFDSRRATGAALVEAGVPLRIGDVTVTPAVNLGAGWARSSRPTEDGSVSASSVGARAGGRIGLRMPLARSFELDCGIGLEVAPFAHHRPRERETEDDDGGDDDDDERVFAGDPWSRVRVAIGVRWGRTQ